MMPIRDDNPTQSVPFVTHGIIVLNFILFGYELILATTGRLPAFIYAYSVIPAQILSGTALPTLLTSMFLHGGFMHVFGNMLYLHIFGDNIEDIMGHGRFIVFYLLCGVLATFLQVFVSPLSTVPQIGASGAVAGILGAYLVTFPRAKVHTVLFLGYFIHWVTIPAVVVLSFWFVIQLFSGLGSLSYGAAELGGVAFFAHIGGFVAGALLIWLFKRKRRGGAAWETQG